MIHLSFTLLWKLYGPIIDMKVAFLVQQEDNIWHDFSLSNDWALEEKTGQPEVAAH